jgi:hypothetical protein
MIMRRFRRLALLAALLTLPLAVPAALVATSAPAAAQTGPGVGVVPQGVQSDTTYAASFAKAEVTNVDATSGQVSCYRPEVPYFVSDGPNDGYTGMSACPSSGATTGEDTGASGPYPTQVGSNPGYPAKGPMLVKDHSESDIRVDPTNPSHLIGSVKWVVSAEGYNHLLGFYESFNGGQTWTVSGHIPGYEGWTDNTDPVGAFDTYGNYYEFILPYQFFYNADGTHDFKVGTPLEPNPVQPAEAVAMAVRPHGATAATDWITTHSGHPDFVATYDSVGNEPDKQWMTIDDNQASPFRNRVYAMWVDFHALTPVPFVSFADAHADGTHTDWSAPQRLPQPPHVPQGATYLLPHVAPDGTIYTTVTNFNPKKGFCCTSAFVDKSTDGGVTWSVVGTAFSNVTPPPLIYPNTTFRDGIENTFAVGNHLVNGKYPLYVAYEDFSAGVDNVMLTASYDGGATWTSPIQVNDNAAPVDEFQPNLTVAPDATVSVNFYDRRLACPAAGTSQAAAAGLALDTVNPNFTGSLPPYGAADYCVNASIQFYTPQLTAIGHNIRISQNTFDPQLNSPHPGSASGEETFIGDYFGNTVGAEPGGAVDYSSFVSTYDDGNNSAHYQQQIVAAVNVP